MKRKPLPKPIDSSFLNHTKKLIQEKLMSNKKISSSEIGIFIQAIEDTCTDYAKRHGRQPTAISLRKDVNDLLHHSSHAFHFDFVDMSMSRERFMGMDVTVTTDGAPFVIEEPGKAE